MKYTDSNFYYIPGTNILKNKPGILKASELNSFEIKNYLNRLSQGIPNGDFSAQHLKDIHKHLFQDIYEWAGRFREVPLAKGESRFCQPQYIEDFLKKSTSKIIIDELKYSRKQEFLRKLSELIGDLNAAHPFIEGNGRTIRNYVEKLCNSCGYEFNQERIQKEDWIKASIRSFNGDNKLLEDVIANTLESKKKEASIMLKDSEGETTKIPVQEKVAVKAGYKDQKQNFVLEKEAAMDPQKLREAVKEKFPEDYGKKGFTSEPKLRNADLVKFREAELKELSGREKTAWEKYKALDPTSQEAGAQAARLDKTMNARHFKEKQYLDAAKDHVKVLSGPEAKALAGKLEGIEQLNKRLFAASRKLEDMAKDPATSSPEIQKQSLHVRELMDRRQAKLAGLRQDMAKSMDQTAERTPQEPAKGVREESARPKAQEAPQRPQKTPATPQKIPAAAERGGKSAEKPQTAGKKPEGIKEPGLGKGLSEVEEKHVGHIQEMPEVREFTKAAQDYDAVSIQVNKARGDLKSLDAQVKDALDPKAGKLSNLPPADAKKLQEAFMRKREALKNLKGLQGSREKVLTASLKGIMAGADKAGVAAGIGKLSTKAGASNVLGTVLGPKFKAAKAVVNKVLDFAKGQER